MIQTFAPIAALLVSIALMMVGHGLQSTIVPLASQELDFSRLEIGAGASAYFAGMIVGFLVSPYAILRAGHIRAAAAIISTGSAAALLHPFVQDPYAWIFFRIITGICVAGFFLVFESWLNEHATNETRGVVMSVYIIISYLALVSGQLLAAVDPANIVFLFAVASIVISLSIVPVTMTRAAQPAPIAIVRFRPGWLYTTSPAAVVAAFFLGGILGTQWMLAPVYATEIGFSASQAPLFAGAIIMGGVLSQWPIGRLSDVYDRRLVLLGLTLVAGSVALFIAMVTPTNLSWLIFIGLLAGAATQPAYSLALAHGYDHADTHDYVELGAGLLIVFSSGSALGPIIATYFMGLVGPKALFIWITVLCVIVAIYLLFRISQRVAPEEDKKEDFALGTSASVIGGVLTPEAPDESHPLFAKPEPFWAEDDEEAKQDETGEPDGTDND